MDINDKEVSAYFSRRNSFAVRKVVFGLVSGVALVEFAQTYEYEALYLYVLRYPVKGQLVMIERIQHTNTVQVRAYICMYRYMYMYSSTWNYKCMAEHSLSSQSWPVLSSI